MRESCWQRLLQLDTQGHLDFHGCHYTFQWTHRPVHPRTDLDLQPDYQCQAFMGFSVHWPGLQHCFRASLVNTEKHAETQHL